MLKLIIKIEIERVSPIMYRLRGSTRRGLELFNNINIKYLARNTNTAGLDLEF